jgi:orotate phosphoribosyltransferase-like protein
VGATSALSVLCALSKELLEENNREEQVQLVTGLSHNGVPVNCMFVDEHGRPVIVDPSTLSAEKLAELGIRTEKQQNDDDDVTVEPVVSAAEVAAASSGPIVQYMVTDGDVEQV